MHVMYGFLSSCASINLSVLKSVASDSDRSVTVFRGVYFAAIFHCDGVGTIDTLEGTWSITKGRPEFRDCTVFPATLNACLNFLANHETRRLAYSFVAIDG